MNIQNILKETDCKIIQDKYIDIYNSYMDSVSNKTIPTSIEQCSLLYLISKNLIGKNILDVGSGISSFFLRKNQKSTNSINYTVDTQIGWLLKTKNFLNTYEVDNENMSEWENFKNTNEIKFDFIYHDMGWIHERIGPIPYLTSILNEKGMIMIDDLHFNNPPDCMFRDFVYSYFDSSDWLEIDIKSLSIDKYGRYATIFIKK